MIETAETEHVINPFKEYQKRRNGHVGQRFHAVIVTHGETTPLYDGEMMMRGWANTERGKTVKFWLDNEATTHPFAGCRKRSGSEVGTLFMGVLVELHDDGSAVDQGQRGVADGKPRKLSAQVHLMITSERFCQFMTERSNKTAALHKRKLSWSSPYPGRPGETMARAYVKSFLKLESLSDLDRDPAKAEQFHKVFRIPFARWNGQENR